MEGNQVDVSSRSTPYRGYMRLDVYNLRHHDFNGGWTINLSREVVERGHAVAVLPYDPDRDKVVLIEQFRIGGYTAPEMSPWQLECVAGIVETHQSTQEAAARETWEEANINILALEPVHTYLSSPGMSSETVTMFCARIEAESVDGIYGLADEGEYIRVFGVDALESFDLLDQGRIENGMTIIALQWLKLNRERLREIWSGATVS